MSAFALLSMNKENTTLAPGKMRILLVRLWEGEVKTFHSINCPITLVWNKTKLIISLL